MINQVVKINMISTRSNVETKHTLNVSIHNDVLKNKNRLLSHCRSLARKTYGNNIAVSSIEDQDGNILVEVANR